MVGIVVETPTERRHELPVLDETFDLRFAVLFVHRLLESIVKGPHPATERVHLDAFTRLMIDQLLGRRIALPAPDVHRPLPSSSFVCPCAAILSRSWTGRRTSSTAQRCSSS